MLDGYETDTCGKKFRHCKNEKQWHAKQIFLALYKLVKTIHSDGSVPPSGSSFDETSSSSDSGTLSPGETIEAHFVADGPYSQVYWYVKAPGDTGYGTEVEIDTGDGVATVASLSYTFPSDADGEYTITAYVYRSNQSVYEESYTVTVESVAEHTGH